MVSVPSLRTVRSTLIASLLVLPALGFFPGAGATFVCPEAYVVSPVGPTMVVSGGTITWTVHQCDVKGIFLTLTTGATTTFSPFTPVACGTHGTISGPVSYTPTYVGPATLKLTAFDCHGGPPITQIVSFSTVVLA